MINGGIKVNVDDDFDLLSFRVIIEFFVKVDVIDNLDFLGSKFMYCNICFCRRFCGDSRI